MSKLCPCHSGLNYRECCKSLHEGEAAKNALQLMRSRYAAYALKKLDYIIKTTHPKSPYFKGDQKSWKEDMMHSYNGVRFEGLEILEFIDGESTAYVTFKAVLKKDKLDQSFIEKSLFEKNNDRWFYHSGVHR